MIETNYQIMYQSLRYFSSRRKTNKEINLYTKRDRTGLTFILRVYDSILNYVRKYISENPPKLISSERVPPSL